MLKATKAILNFGKTYIAVQLVTIMLMVLKHLRLEVINAADQQQSQRCQGKPVLEPDDESALSLQQRLLGLLRSHSVLF